MYISSIIVKIRLSNSARSAFDNFFRIVNTVECGKGVISMHEGMLAIQLFGDSTVDITSKPNPEDAIKVLTNFVSQLKELAGVFEKEALS